MTNGWEALNDGIFQGLGVLAVVWCAHQVRKFWYYHSRWRFFSHFDDRTKDFSPFDWPVLDDGRQLYWAPMERILSKAEPYWAYIPLLAEKPSWWDWMRCSFSYAFKYQQWKPIEYLHPTHMEELAS